MAYDPERFRRAYLPGALPCPLVDGFAVTAVLRDRVRAAIDLRIEAPDGRGLTVFVERAVEGGTCFAQTAYLALSYYAEGRVDDATAARITSQLVTRFRAMEAKRGSGLEDALVLGPQRRMLELRINRECNERCLFCNTPERSETILPSSAAIHVALRRERAAGYEDVMFTGREPTFAPELPNYLRAARELGYRAIRVQTNGTSFASETALRRATDAGMNEVEISLHTLDPATFDRLIGPPRLLHKTLEALANLSRTDVAVYIVCVLTRLNLTHLPGVLERLAAVHPRVAQITVSPMAPVGDGAAHLELVPRLSELHEPLRRGLEVAARLGLRVTIPSRCGAPLCVMPEGKEAHNAELQNPPGQTLEAHKVKPEACGACVYDAVCTGLWRPYLERYGAGEVRPRLKGCR